MLEQLTHGRTIRFRVEGVPVPWSSPKLNTRTGRWYKAGRHAGSRDPGAWQAAVEFRGKQAMRGLAPLEGPVWLQVTFWLPRPKAHHVAGDPRRPLKAWAPRWHTRKPDRDNLVKAVQDALNGVAWRDDSQVCTGAIHKRYADTRGDTGAEIAVSPVR